MREVIGAEDVATVEDVAAKVLDGVKIMRVFDFVGVKEAVGEVRSELEGSEVRQVEEEDATAKEQEPKAPIPSLLTPEPLPKDPLPKRTVVADSEDEDEEMLFDTSEPAPAVQLVPPSIPPPPQSPSNPFKTPSNSTFKFLLIDSLSQTLTSLLKPSLVQPIPALISTFLISLAHLTRTHGLYTVLATSTIVPKITNSARSADPARSPNPTRPPSPTRHQESIPPPSIFASNTAVPSLMGVLSRYVDMQILVGEVSRGWKDRGVRDRRNVGRKLNGRGKGGDTVCVVEVIGERWEGSGGGWGVFEQLDT